MGGHVLLAPDKFKGSLTAAEVVRHLSVGLRRACPAARVRGFPVADGGEGTLDAAISAGFTRKPVRATGPTGVPVDTAFAHADGVAIVELADACGQRRLPGGRAEPLHAGSHGVGEVVRAALDHGCREIVLGLGGSASTDGGAGLVAALGVRLLDEHGVDLPPGGAALRRLHRIDVSGLHPAVRHTRFVLACDVDNPLLGPTGAAAVYGPQKGATDADVAVLETGLTRWAALAAAELPRLPYQPAAAQPEVVGRPAAAQPEVVDRPAAGQPEVVRRPAAAQPEAADRPAAGLPRLLDRADAPGAGAAGGVGFGALVFLGATFRPGIELLLDLLGFADLLAGAALVVTGEGSLDGQSLRGKAPVGVASAAAGRGVPTVAVVGRLAVGADDLRAAGIGRAYPLTDLEPDLRRCVAEAPRLVQAVAARVAADWLEPSGRRRPAPRCERLGRGPSYTNSVNRGPFLSAEGEEL